MGVLSKGGQMRKMKRSSLVFSILLFIFYFRFVPSVPFLLIVFLINYFQGHFTPMHTIALLLTLSYPIFYAIAVTKTAEFRKISIYTLLPLFIYACIILLDKIFNVLYDVSANNLPRG